MTDRAQTWDEYDEQRGVWLSRLMFGQMHPDPEMRRMMQAGPPPEIPEDGDGRE